LLHSLEGTAQIASVAAFAREEKEAKTTSTPTPTTKISGSKEVDDEFVGKGNLLHKECGKNPDHDQQQGRNGKATAKAGGQREE
jgi:hypothetical protein